MGTAPDQLPDDAPALKQIIAAMAQDAVAAQAEIAKLRFQLARYRRAEFGRPSEKLARGGEQLELAIEALEADQAERLAAGSPVVAAALGTAVEAQEPAWRAGSGIRPQRYNRRSPRSRNRCWRPTPCTATTRRCPCCRRVPARPRPAGYGPTSSTSARSPRLKAPSSAASNPQLFLADLLA